MENEKKSREETLLIFFLAFIIKKNDISSPVPLPLSVVGAQKGKVSVKELPFVARYISAKCGLLRKRRLVHVELSLVYKHQLLDSVPA